jgi:hypothetical protein
MGQARRRKLAGLPPRNLPKVPTPNQMYVEDIDRIQKDHLARCSDKHCTGVFFQRYPDIKLVAMVDKNKPKQIALAPYGGYTSHDYKPLFVLNLEDGSEITSLLEGDCDCVHCDTPVHGPVCLAFNCHNAGAALLFDMKEPNTLTIICADKSCGNPVSYKGFNGKVRLAPQPKAEYPNILCGKHGIRPAYLACEHVFKGATPLVLAHPTSDSRGIALCGDRCYQRCASGEHKDEFHSACVESLTEILGDRLTHGEVTADYTN